MSPPSCPLTGRHIRYICLIAIYAYFIYFIVTGIKEQSSERTVFICLDEDTTSLKQCNGLDDYTTCGEGITCIESSCGYKLFNHIDVSVAGSSDPYEESGATSTTSFLSVMSIFYGLMPYLFAFIYVIMFLTFGDLVSLSRLVVLGVISIVNDGILKQFFSQYRPTGSCLYFSSYGMPSGHAATSIGLMTYILLEMFTCHPNMLCGLTCQKRDISYYYVWGYGWLKQTTDIDEQVDSAKEESPDADPSNSVRIDIKDNADESSINIEQTDENEAINSGDIEEASPSPQPLLSEPINLPLHNTWINTATKQLKYHLYAIYYMILLLPVPFSRVYLHDHLWTQVLAGSCIGIITASVWYLCCVRLCIGTKMHWRRNSDWAKWWGLRCSQTGGLICGK